MTTTNLVSAARALLAHLDMPGLRQAAASKEPNKSARSSCAFGGSLHYASAVALADAIAAMPTDQGPLVCVPAKWVEDAAECIEYAAATMLTHRIIDAAPGHHNLATKLRSVLPLPDDGRAGG